MVRVVVRVVVHRVVVRVVLRLVVKVVLKVVVRVVLGVVGRVVLRVVVRVVLRVVVGVVIRVLNCVDLSWLEFSDFIMVSLSLSIISLSLYYLTTAPLVQGPFGPNKTYGPHATVFVFFF